MGVLTSSRLAAYSGAGLVVSGRARGRFSAGPVVNLRY